MSEVEEFLFTQYLLSDSPELDFWIAHLARNCGYDWLADCIEDEL